ncbi:hypothetical protein ACWDUL_20680 [Nocardia niigatensis]
MSHYLIGAVDSIGSNLIDAAAHLENYRDAVRKETIFYARKVREANGGVPALGARNDLDELRIATLTAEGKGFFRAIGSVFDTMAATVIGIGALNLNIVKADWGQLCTTDPDPTYPRTSGQNYAKLRRALAAAGTPGGDAQDRLLQAVRGAVNAAGPENWVPWVHAIRNAYVHRSQWMDMLVMADKRNPEAGVHRLLPIQPQLVEGQQLQTATSLADMMLSEDAEVTMTGLLGSVVPVVQAVTGACATTWIRRRSQPRMLVQPFDSAWLPTAVPRFAGYDPDHAKAAIAAAKQVAFAPPTGRRLAALNLPGK